jgi:ribosomal protein S18 acetylase RimI-like enzyme
MTSSHSSTGDLRGRPVSERPVSELARMAAAWFEASVLKRRYVFACDRESYSRRNGGAADYSVVVVAPSDSAAPREEIAAQLANHLPPERVRRRLGDPRFTLYLARSLRTGELAGYNWLLKADTVPVWHDCFCLRPGEALIVNAFVLPAHRRRGVYTLLLEETFASLFAGGHRFGFAIVEARNTPAVRHNRQFGFYVGFRNFLVKALGVNALSLSFGRLGVRVAYVYRNAKSRST